MIQPRAGHDGVATPPTLITKRLILRPYRVDDLDPACAMWADEDTYRFIGGLARTRAQPDRLSGGRLGSLTRRARQGIRQRGA